MRPPQQRPRLPTTILSRRTFSTTPTRPADLIKRPKRPYTFTQLITLSDGSSVLHRTTSPLPLYRSTKDVRNSPKWNPSNAKIAAVEEDEAGRLRAFRRRFGRGWDAVAAPTKGDPEAEGGIEAPMTTPVAPTGEGDARYSVPAPETALGAEDGAMAPGVGDANVLGEGREVRHDGVGEVEAERQVGRARDAKTGEVVSDSKWSKQKEENLMDLVSRYGRLAGDQGAAKGSNEPAKRSGKGKGGEK